MGGKRQAGRSGFTAGRNEPDLSGLSEEERAQFDRKYNRTKGGIRSEEGTVPQKVHEDRVRDLEGQISVLKGTVDGLKDEKAGIRKERDDYKARFERKVEELQKAEDDLESVRKERAGLAEENRDLRARLESAPKAPAPVRDDAEERRLRKEVSGLRSELEEARGERDEAAAELDAERARVRELEARVAELESSARPQEPRDEPVGTVRRTSPTRLESELFTEPRYRIVLSRDGHRMTFSPDVEGRTLCTDCAIELPVMEMKLPFSGAAEYTAFRTSGGVLRIALRGARRRLPVGYGLHPSSGDDDSFVRHLALMIYICILILCILQHSFNHRM